jgi:hypothetical protein
MLGSHRLFMFGRLGPYNHIYVSPDSSDTNLGTLAECSRSSWRVRTNCPNDTLPSNHAYTTAYSEPRKVCLWYKSVGDILWATEILLVTTALASVLSQHTFSGIEFHPVELYRDRGCKEPMPGYVEMRILGRVPLDLAASGVKVTHKCELCGAVRYGLWTREKGIHFQGEVDEWPDVFTTSQRITAYRFVKRRFAQLLVDLGVRPFILVRPEDLVPGAPWLGDDDESP